MVETIVFNPFYSKKMMSESMTMLEADFLKAVGDRDDVKFRVVEPDAESVVAGSFRDVIGESLNGYPYMFRKEEEAYVLLKEIMKDYGAARQKIEPLRKHIKDNFDASKAGDVVREKIFDGVKKNRKIAVTAGSKRLADNVLSGMGDKILWSRFVQGLVDNSHEGKNMFEPEKCGFFGAAPPLLSFYHYLLSLGYVDTLDSVDPMLIKK